MLKDIIILEIEFEYEGTKQKIHPVILRDNSNIVLVDCGYEETLDLLLEEIKNKGIKIEDITVLYLTHQDDDHMGGAFRLKKLYPHIEIVTSQAEEKYISGKEKNLRLKQGEDFLKILPPEQKEFGIKFCERMRGLKTVIVDRTVKIGDKLNWCGGCEIVDSKGHTPGHTSLYLTNSKTLIVGDAGVIENDRLVVANPQFCLDITEAEKSLERIKSFDIEYFICYHGGFLKNF